MPALVPLQSSAAGDARLQFLRRLFHDLATPLSAVSLHLEGADRRVRRGEDPSDSLGIARTELGRAFELFDRGRELLLASRGAPSSFDFDDWVEEVVRRRDTGRRLSLSGTTGGRVFGDRESLAGALEALLANALEFSDGLAPVTVLRLRDDASLAVRVQNPGRLPGDDSEKLFAPGLTAPGRNWGMGLPRARLAAAEAGGVVILTEEGGVVSATLAIPEKRGP